MKCVGKHMSDTRMTFMSCHESRVSSIYNQMTKCFTLNPDLVSLGLLTKTRARNLNQIPGSKPASSLGSEEFDLPLRRP